MNRESYDVTGPNALARLGQNRFTSLHYGICDGNMVSNENENGVFGASTKVHQ